MIVTGFDGMVGVRVFMIVGGCDSVVDVAV